MTFQEWLLNKGYQQATANSTVRMLRRAREAHKEGLGVHVYASYLKRWLTYLQETNEPESDVAFVRAVRETVDPIEPAPLGSTERVPLTESQATSLRYALKAGDEPEDLLLLVLMSLEHPAQDLRVTLAEPLGELVKRLPVSLKTRLRPYQRAGAIDLYEVVCGGPCTFEALYGRLNRRMGAWRKSTGIDFDLKSLERTPLTYRTVV